MLVLMRSYDHVFKGGYKRVSGGVEYVAGLNEFHAQSVPKSRELMIENI